MKRVPRTRRAKKALGIAALARRTRVVGLHCDLACFPPCVARFQLLVFLRRFAASVPYSFSRKALSLGGAVGPPRVELLETSANRRDAETLRQRGEKEPGADDVKKRLHQGSSLIRSYSSLPLRLFGSAVNRDSSARQFDLRDDSLMGDTQPASAAWRVQFLPRL